MKHGNGRKGENMAKADVETIKAIVNESVKQERVELEKSINERIENVDARQNQFKYFIIELIIAILPTVILTVFGMYKGVFELPARFNEYRNEYHSFQSSVNSQMTQYQNQLSDLMILKGQFQEFEKNQITSAPTLYPTKTMVKAIDVFANADKENSIDAKVISAEDIVAESGDGKNKFTAEQICNQKIIMPYKQNGVEVYFVGQLNENLHWNGYCLLNKYNKNNQLIYVTEATYIDGVLLGYKQAYLEDDNETWCLSEKVVKDGFFEGVSKEYLGVREQFKKFGINDVTGEDIISLSKYENEYISLAKMEKYYYGRTMQSQYNDSTGNAYYVLFDTDGKVLTLYQGGFKDGQFYDKTGNAWYITRKTKDNNPNKKYDYYKGLFPAEKDLGIRENDVSLSRINEIIKSGYFNVELKWYGEED